MRNIKIRLFIYVALLALAVGSMHFLRHCSTKKVRQHAPAVELPRDLHEIQREGILRLIAPYSFVPTDSQRLGSIQGLAFIKQLSHRSKAQVELTFEDNTMKAIQLLLIGEADAVLSSIAKTSQLDSLPIAWVSENTSLPLYLVQRKEDTLAIAKHSDLNGKCLTIPSNSPYSLFIKHLSDDLGIKIKVKEDSLYNTEQLIMMVQSGKEAYTICNGEDIDRYQRHFPKLDFSLPLSHALRRGWIVRKDSPILKDSLIKWLH